MHDPPLVGEHRLERHRLPGRAHARRDALGDLAELILPPAPVSLNVDGDVHRPADAARCDGRSDLLKGDEVLATTADQCPQVRAEDLDALVPQPVIESDLRLDPHQGEQVLEHPGPRRELFSERG